MQVSTSVSACTCSATRVARALPLLESCPHGAELQPAAAEVPLYACAAQKTLRSACRLHSPWTLTAADVKPTKAPEPPAKARPSQSSRPKS